MRDLRFISGDAEALILETADGERVRIAVDRALRDALSRQPSSSGDHALSPREIQDAIRNGATVDSLVASSGESIDYILKFATPVIEELEHMTQMALSVRVEVGPDKYNETRLREFGELMLERLRNGGASAIAWSTSRQSPTTWLIEANFETMGGLGLAQWSFEPRKAILSPENETAASLSNQAGFGDSPIPKLKPLLPPSDNAEAAQPESAPVTELLDAFKARREAAAVEVSAEPEGLEDQSDKPKGRAPMPSWDQIIFGAKSDEQSSED